MTKTLRNFAVAAALVAAGTATQGVMAADLVQKNAYAYDVRVDKTDEHNPVISYKLNGLAGAVTVRALADGREIAKKEGTVNQSNQVTVKLPEGAYGNITFTVDVTTKTTVTTPTLIKEGVNIKLTNVSHGYRFNVPMGVAVNNSPNSPTFGQIVVPEYSAPTGNEYHSSTAGGGRGNALYVFDPQMQPIKNPQATNAHGFSGGLNMVKGEFNRVRFAEDGRLFMYSYNATEGCGVYEFNTKGTDASDANTYNQQAVQVLTVTKPVSENSNGAITSFDVIGSGENLKLGVLEVKIGNTDATNYGSKVVTPKFYNLGTKTQWEGEPSITISNETQYLRTILRCQYINSAWDRDGKGFSVIGFAASPTNTNEGLVHFDMTKSTPEVNYESGGTDGSLFQNAYAVAMNNDGTLLAMGGGKDAGHIHIYAVTYDENGKPSYTEKYDITATGTTMTDVAFDYANNLYVTNRSGEYFAAWQLPASIAGSSKSTPSMSSQAYYIEKPAAKIYVVGAFNGWDPSTPKEIEVDINGNYVFNIDNAEEGFKLSTTKGSNSGDWAGFNEGILGYSNDACVVKGGWEQKLYGGADMNSGNLKAPVAGQWEWTLTRSDEEDILSLSGRPDGLPDYLYVRGELTDNYDADENYVITIADTDSKGNPKMTDSDSKYEYKYSAKFTDFRGDFKIADKDWNINYGKGGQNTKDGAQDAVDNGGNFALNGMNYVDFKIDFYYNIDKAGASWIEYSGKPRGHYAYNLQHLSSSVNDNNPNYTFRFHSTGAAEKAILHFTRRPDPEILRTLATDGDDNDAQFDLEYGPVIAGENEATFYADKFPRNNYDWSVELVNSAAPTEDIVTDPINIGGGYGALATFLDANYSDVYGYTVIGRSSNSGIDIYDATGKKVASKLFADNSLLGGVNPDLNGSTGDQTYDASPSDGTTFGNNVFLSSSNAKAYGVVTFNLKDYIDGKQTDLNAVYEGTNNNGVITNNGVKVGSPTTTVGIWGTDADARIVVFDRLVFGQNWLSQNILINNKVTAALQKLTYSAQSFFMNGRVQVATVKNGVFAAQYRGNGLADTTSGLRYFTMPDGNNKWYFNQVLAKYPNFPTMVPTGGVAVNAEETLLALATSSGINIYNLNWNEDGTPDFGEGPAKIIKYPFTSNNALTTVKFDAAGNLHVINKNNGYFRILFGNYLTSAPAELYVNGTATGVEDIKADADNSDAVYYNMNGVRIDRANLVPGVYVKVVGKTATKVVIR